MALKIAVVIAFHRDMDTDLELQAWVACRKALESQLDDDISIISVDSVYSEDAMFCTAKLPAHSSLPNYPYAESFRQTEQHISMSTINTPLTPDLWQLGIERVNVGTSMTPSIEADVVALTIAPCIPAPDWIASIRRAFENPDVVAVGGVFHPPENGSPVDWAVYFARYSGFIPSSSTTPKPVNDIAADNGAYRLSAINACKSTWAGGFWETLVHPCLRENGGQILFDPALQVRFGTRINLWAMAKQRFRHGRHYGSTRPGNRMIRALTSPAIPFVLLLRIVRRVRASHPEWMPQLLRALPALITLIMAWSIGEASGYLRPKTR